MDILKNILPLRLFEVTEKGGICTPKQLMILSIWDIKKKTNLKYDDAIMLKHIVTQYFCPPSLTGDKLDKLERKLGTGCTSIDKVLNGGFRKGTLIEIYGESGTGKTQLVMQVAAHSGNEGSVFICTEDLFPVKRFHQINKNICKTSNSDCGNNMFIEHITEANELVACIKVRLPRLLSTKKVSVVIIDSVAAPFRCEYTNYVKRAEDLKELGILLYKLAQEHNITIICVNQVTSTFDNSEVLPSLGLVWSNMVCYKLNINKLSKVCVRNGQDFTLRELNIVKAPDLPIAGVNFIITVNGIECVGEQMSA